MGGWRMAKCFLSGSLGLLRYQPENFLLIKRIPFARGHLVEL
jgi:hypothetical protein